MIGDRFVPPTHRWLALCLLAASPAWAGGMFLPARGARALGRAGSFVAGADDVSAFYYNPAGLADIARGSVLLDAGLVFQRVHYDRIDSGGVAQPGIDNDNALLPIPLLGLSYRPQAFKERLTLAGGLFAPYTGIPRYSESGPQRYSLVSLDGTAGVVFELAVGWRVTPNFFLGAGFQSMFFLVSNTTVLSSCSQVNCAPEDPNFDSPTQNKVTAPFVPSGNFGAIVAYPTWRLGLSVQLPYWVNATGTVHSRLPPDPQFDGAVIVGDRLDVSFTLPAAIRAGVELRPLPALRVELGGDYETWQMHDRINFTPVGVYLNHVAGIGRYDLRPMFIDRRFQGVWAVHVGGEYALLPDRLTLRAGYLFESSAVPDETLSVFTPDGDKHLMTLGASVRWRQLRFDLGYGHFFQGDRVVTNSQSLQLNPIQPTLAVPVGNGRYAVATDVLSIGFEGKF